MKSCDSPSACNEVSAATLVRVDLLLKSTATVLASSVLGIEIFDGGIAFDLKACLSSAECLSSVLSCCLLRSAVDSKCFTWFEILGVIFIVAGDKEERDESEICKVDKS